MAMVAFISPSTRVSVGQSGIQAYRVSIPVVSMMFDHMQRAPKPLFGPLATDNDLEFPQVLHGYLRFKSRSGGDKEDEDMP